MVMSINEFKSNGLIGGGARPANFRVIIPTWPGSSQTAARKTSFLAKAASLPPSVVDPIEVPYMGRRIKIMGDRTFPGWSITVMNDEDFDLRESFEEWHQLLNARQENILSRPLTTNPESYKVNIVVEQLSKDGSSLYRYTLVGAFPTVVDQIQLDWEAINQFEQFNVEFQYDYWEPFELTSSNGLTQEFVQSAISG